MSVKFSGRCFRLGFSECALGFTAPMRAPICFRLFLFFRARFRFSNALEIDDVSHCRLDVGRYLREAKSLIDQ